MKKYGIFIALVVAVLSGILAVSLANRWLASQKPEEIAATTEKIPMAEIMVATRDLPIGTRLTENSMAAAEWPASNVPRGAFEDAAGLNGRVTAARVAAGTPIIASQLASADSGAGLVALIPPGKRAMAIKVDEVIGVGGFVLPDTRVDVISVRKENRGQGHSETILKDIPVLAIAQETAVENGKAKIVRTVTLAVEPKEAEKLALETNLGSIQLVLRNPNEVEPEPAPKVAKAAPPPKPRHVPVLRPRVYKPKPAVFQVEVIRGERQPEKFEFQTKQ